MLTRAANTELYYRLNHGMAQSAADSIAVGSGATCYNLVNNSGVDYFVPTKTANEYNLFVAARERLGVTISPCQSCGDGSCNNGETCYSCPGDCGACPCGHQSDCASGYYCYDFAAYCNGAENHSCFGFDKAQCDSGCYWDVTKQGYCVSGTCTPLCAGKSCGPNYCGGTCGTCGGGYACSMAGTCASTSACGDGSCNNGETCSTCSTDCGACCSDNSDCTSGKYCSGYNAYCTGLESHGCLDGYSKTDCISIGCEWYVDVMGTCIW